MKIFDLINKNRDMFSDEFVNWLPENIHIFQAFSAEAIKIAEKGFKHYSARTIIHVLRHHSAIAEVGSEWKINDHYSPYLARLFDLVYPHKAGLFAYRFTPAAESDSLKRFNNAKK